MLHSMYKKGLVTIITPSYNSAHLITRLLDSVLTQTYPNVEMFVIDDGSTDDTKDVVESYILAFQRRGYVLHYAYQENAGQNAAINNALKWVTGEYLLYPDSDDWYKTDDAISIMVNTMNHYGDEVGVVRCQYEMIDAETMKVINHTVFQPCDIPCDLFEDAFYGTNGFRYSPIEFILKTKFLDKYIKGREIFVARFIGQNYQVLLPYFANSRCVTINKVLCCYLVRQNSASRRKRSYEDWLLRKTRGMKCLEYTLSTIDTIAEMRREDLLRNKRAVFYNDCMALAIEYSKKTEFRKFYTQAKREYAHIEQKYRVAWIWTVVLPMQSYKWGQALWRKCKRIFSRK